MLLIRKGPSDIRSHLCFFVALLLLQVCFPARAQSNDWYCETGADVAKVEWVNTDLGEQKIVIVGQTESGQAETLIVFLHADSPFNDPVYQYEIARKISLRRENTIVAAVLRPGYKDSCDDRSDGEAGRKMGDNYTSEVVDSLAAVIRDLVTSFNPGKTVLIGHSGGAALGALLASRHSQIQDQVILAACPCDLPAWRERMMQLTENSGWSDSMPGLSAIDEVGKLDSSKRISLLVGDEDAVTPPFLSTRYLDALLAAGVSTDLTIVNGGDHDMILRDDILKIVLSKIED